MYNKQTKNTQLICRYAVMCVYLKKAACSKPSPHTIWSSWANALCVSLCPLVVLLLGQRGMCLCFDNICCSCWFKSRVACHCARRQTNREVFVRCVHVCLGGVCVCACRRQDEACHIPPLQTACKYFACPYIKPTHLFKKNRACRHELNNVLVSQLIKIMLNTNCIFYQLNSII